MTDDEVRNLIAGDHVQYACKQCGHQCSGIVRGVLSYGRTSGKEAHRWARVLLDDGGSIVVESDAYIRHFGKETHNSLGRRVAGVDVFKCPTTF